MRSVITLLAHVLLVSVAQVVSAQDVKDVLPSAPEGKTWKLVWHDEFEGTELDSAKWDIPEYKRRDAYWSRKAISLDGKGHLVMATFKEGEVGKWEGDIKKANLPDQFLVDYVRVYDLVEKIRRY